MPIRDRILRLDRVPVEQLHASPKNWRTHPDNQRSALADMLGDVGFAAPVVARQRADGTLELIDGHLRVETMPAGSTVPVVVLDVTEAEAGKLLATMDPLSALAGQDDAKLLTLLGQIDSDSAAVQAMLGDLVTVEAVEKAAQALGQIPESFEILVTCRSEQEQVELLNRLTEEGVQCRSLIS